MAHAKGIQQSSAESNNDGDGGGDKDRFGEHFQARSYQVELFEAACEQNTIVCLKTGAGKTFIAVMLIKEYQHEIAKDYDLGKRTFFIVPKVPLVVQQAKAISVHTHLDVGLYYGAMGVDFWNGDDWLRELRKHHVLVMTPQILLNLLNAGYMSLNKINLIVFDECHAATGKSPYCEIMSRYEDFVDRPRILGLSASILNGKCKPDRIPLAMEKLEKTLHCRIASSRDMVTVHRHSTKPKEIVIVCSDRSTVQGGVVGTSNSTNSLEADVHRLLEDCGSLILSTVQKAKADGGNNRILMWLGIGADQSFEEDEEGLDLSLSPYRMLKNIGAVLSQLGVYCACIIIDKYAADLPKLCQDARSRLNADHEMMYNMLENTLTEVRRRMSSQLTPIDMVTPKVARLLEFLYAFWSANTATTMNAFRGIVFVEYRVVVWILCEYLTHVAQAVPRRYGFLRPCYVVGHGLSLPFLKQSNMSVEKQNSVLEGFRVGTSNLMIATKVLQEGIDIPKCNVVVAFDPPKDCCSYVQSMGRARAERALYVLLVYKSDFVDFQDDLVGYKVIESILQNKCHDRTMPSESETFDFHSSRSKIAPFYPAGREGACLTLNGALSILNMYVNRLPHDRYTTLKAHFKYMTVDAGQCRCIVTLPSGCPIRAPIIGYPMSNKEEAKQAAGYRVCELLYRSGELNDHLLPCTDYSKKYISQLGIAPEEVVEKPGPMPGTRKRRLIYDKKMVFLFGEFYPKPNGITVLYLICARSASTTTKDRDDCDDECESCRFGILCAAPIASVLPFALYEKSKYIVHLRLERDRADNVVSEVEFARLEAFHRVLFEDIMKVAGCNLAFRPEESNSAFLIVPVRQRRPLSGAYDIDWQTIQRSEDLQKERDSSDRDLFVPDVGSIVERTYGGVSITSKRFVVLEVKNPSSPLDAFVSSECVRTTYKSYLEDKYGVRVCHDSQPLIRVCYAPNATSLLVPSTTTKAATEQLLVPEHVRQLCLDAEAYRHAYFIPSLLHRLNGLQLAKKLTDDILADALVDSSVYGSDDGVALEDICRKMTITDDTIFCSYDAVPVAVDGNKVCALLFQALTTRSAANWDDLERLELIGDSFLKFVVSVFLYCKFAVINEGCLTTLRSLLIKNSTLSNCAKARGVPEILNASMFRPRINWLPPGYMMHHHFVDTLLAAKIPPHLWPFAEDELNERSSSLPLPLQQSGWLDVLLERWAATDPSNRDAAVKQQTDEGGAIYNDVYNHYSQQLIGDKTVADSVEAMIGAVLASCGQAAALRLINWFGLHLELKRKDTDSPPPRDAECLPLFDWQPPKTTALLRKLTKEDAETVYVGLDCIERCLAYGFEDKSFLRQAFVHPSHTAHPVTDNYQKLEFLGDAILDYLITLHLFKANPFMCPGDMTDLRSSLVDNSTFAFLTVKWGLHKHLRHKSFPLYQAIDAYLVHHAKLKDPKDAVYMVGENDVLELIDVEVPKALGDIFESVAGAVYIDSGYSLRAVWNVFFPIMKDLIEMYSKSLPINPVRKLHEHDSSVTFEKPVRRTNDPDSLYTVVANCGGKSYTGCGNKKSVAKQAAAKCALRALRINSVRELHAIRPAV